MSLRDNTSDTVPVNCLERVLLEDLFLQVADDELAFSVIARERVGRLREVVRAK